MKLNLVIRVSFWRIDLQICVENRNLNTAFSLFSEMKRNRVKPNLVSMNFEAYAAMSIFSTFCTLLTCLDGYSSY